MKKLTTLVSVLSLLAVMNCSKSKDATPAASIVGTWLQTTNTFSSCDQVADNGSKSCNPDCVSLTFKSDGTWTDDDGGSGTYSVSGSTLSIDGAVSYPFTLTSTTLTIAGISTSMRVNGSAPDGFDNCILDLSYTRQ